MKLTGLAYGRGIASVRSMEGEGDIPFAERILLSWTEFETVLDAVVGRINGLTDRRLLDETWETLGCCCYFLASPLLCFFVSPYCILCVKSWVCS